MSVSLISKPYDYSPAYNPIPWVFSSTNYAECDMSFICDVYVNGTFAIRLKELPSLDHKGHFQLQSVIQDYLSFNFHHNLVGWEDNGNSIVSYFIEVRERYNTSTDCTGSTTLSAVLYTSDVCYAWNGALQYHEFPSYDQSDYLASGPSSKVLNNIPFRSSISIDSYFTLNILQEPNQVFGIRIKTYGPSGLIDAYDYLNDISPSPTDTAQLMLSVGVGPASINTYTFSASPQPTQPVIHSGVKYYTVHFIDSSLDQISEVKQFEVDLRCTAFEKHRIWWFSRLGGFDTFQFGLKSFRNVDITKTTFDKILATNYSVGDRGETALSIDAKEGFVFNTNWLTQDEADWMEKLFTSLEAYVDYYKTTLKKLTITGLADDSGFAQFTIDDSSGAVEIGTSFKYQVDDGSVIGIPSTGIGVVTSSAGAGQYTTSVPSSVPSGAFVSGVFSYDILEIKTIPVIINSNSYEEKSKLNVKNIQYSINVRPSYKLNIQST